MERIQLPKKSLKGLQQLLVDIPAAAERQLVSVELPAEQGPRAPVMFDVGILLRASNALKAIRILCAEAHWEFAVATVRQLFELVINLEHLAAQADREAAIFRYAKYGLLQTVRHQQLDLLYQHKTGRQIDTQRLALLEQMLEQTFPEFRSVGRTGDVHFAKSWSGHDARYLAERSRHPLRADQYDLLYASRSEQTHAAPAALIETMFPRGLSPEQIIAGDLVRIVETITMAITLFLELCVAAPGAAGRGEPAHRVADEDDRRGAQARRARSAVRRRRQGRVAIPPPDIFTPRVAMVGRTGAERDRTRSGPAACDDNVVVVGRQQAIEDGLYEKWRAWIERVYDETVTLFAYRSFYRGVAEMTQANEEIPPSSLFDALGAWYATTQAMGVRRQTDVGADALSLAKLLTNMADHPEVMTRSRFLSLWGDEEHWQRRGPAEIGSSTDPSTSSNVVSVTTSVNCAAAAAAPAQQLSPLVPRRLYSASPARPGLQPGRLSQLPCDLHRP